MGFRLAHLTDAHLPLVGGFAPAELLSKRGLSALNWLRRRRRLHLRAVADALRADVRAHAPDHVAMTGDAVNFGLVREAAAAADWLAGFGPPEAVSFVPGNHEALTAPFAGPLAAAFAPFATGDDGGACPWLRRRGPLALIGVATAAPSPPFRATGAAGAEGVAALRARLRDASGAVAVALIHHPPTALAKPRKALLDRAAVAAALAEGGAGLVLHGHDHRNELSWIDGPAGRIPVLGAPAASTPFGRGAEPAEWRLLTFGDGEVEVLRRALGPGGFADRGRFRLRLPS